MDAYSDEEWKDSDEEGGSPEESYHRVAIQPSYVLIAIDIDKSMFITDTENSSAFHNCIEACFDFYNSLVLTERSVKGPICIVLANNDAGKATFIDFNQPLPDSVKLLKELKLLTSNQLKDRYLRSDDFDLADFFLFCKNKLSSITDDAYKKSVYYITNNDNPVQSNAKQRFRVLSESQKFAALEINLYVVTFKKEFDRQNLYSEVLQTSNSPSVRIIEDVNGLTNEISNLVKRRFSKYRIKFFPFPGDSESYLDLVINKFVKSAGTLKNMYVTRDTQKEVKKLTKQTYTPNYTCTYNPKVAPLTISAAERACLTETNIPIGITLLYVSDERLRKGWIIEMPSMIEKHSKETTIIFDAFWQYCKDNSKCLVCIRKYKKGSECRIIELIPKFVNNKRMFLALSHPFANDVFYTPRTRNENFQFDTEERNVMSSLVDSLTFDFNPKDFSDPVISKRRAYIRSQLLDEPLEDVIDSTPNDQIIDEKINHFVNEFRRLYLMDDFSTGKRTARPHASASKRAKGK